MTILMQHQLKISRYISWGRLEIGELAIFSIVVVRLMSVKTNAYIDEKIGVWNDVNGFLS